MKHLRIVLLGALAALALMATAAGSASAAGSICSSATTGSPTTCPAGTAYTGAVNFELARTSPATSEQAVLTGSFFGINDTITCTTGTEDLYAAGGEGSWGTGNIATNNPITGTIATFAFKNCSDALGTCNVTIGNLPWNVTATGAMVAGGRDGTMTVTVPTGAVNVACNFGTCTFGSFSVTGDVYNPGNTARKDTTGPDAAAGQVHFPGVTLNSQTAACGNGTWKGNYAIRSGSTLGAGSNLWISEA